MVINNKYPHLLVFRLAVKLVHLIMLFKQKFLKDAVRNAYFGRNDNGWMNTNIFYGSLGNQYVNGIIPDHPVLIVDGHGSVIDLEVSNVAK